MLATWVLEYIYFKPINTPMKFTHSLLLTAACLFGAAAMHAQSGMTPVNGTNPQAKNSQLQQSTYSTAKVIPDQPLDGDGKLGPAYQGSECGLNYCTATQKLGQRFGPPGVPQPAAFNINCIPSTATVIQAFVWCDASGNGAPITLNVTNPASLGFSVPMTLVGTDVDKCWGYANSTTYRADVTATISGNGTYFISGFPTGSPNDVDGATMIVIWKDLSAGYQGDLIIWDGAMVGIGVPTSGTMTGFSACTGNVMNARTFMGIGDLQGLGSQLTLNNNSPYTVTEDWWNFIDVPTVVTPGQNTSTFGNTVSGDCYNIALYGLYFQSDCKTCDFPCDAKPEFNWSGCNPVAFDGRNDGVSPVVGWYWQFGDGATSTLEDPTHAYAANGTYTVCLTIISVSSKGETCCNQICHEVQVCDPTPCQVQADFHWYTTQNNPLLANFTDATTYSGGTPCHYKVDFGDGSPVYSGPTMPPNHLYPALGTYTMCISVTVCVYDAAGNVIDKCESTFCRKVKIVDGPNSGRMINPSNTNAQQSSISVFPNPANTQINIAVATNETVQVRIFNANGQQVAVAKQSGKNVYQADVSQLPAGVYFVTVQTADGTTEKQSFVKE